MSLSVLIIGFLISTSSLNVVNTKALVEKEYNHFSIDSFDLSTWNWNITEVVSTESTSTSQNPSLAVDSSGNVHVAWYDVTDYAGSGTDQDIFYKRWDASTSLWTTTEVVSTESTNDSYSPSLAIDSIGNIHVTWQDWTDYAGSGTDQDIFYKRWDASTLLWTTTEVVSTESTDASKYPSLATDFVGKVHITWYEYTDYAGSGTDTDIFYKRWDASTLLWTITEVVSTESTIGSYHPSLAVDSAGNVHIAWDDWTDYAGSGTDQDIFYKRWDASTSLWTTTEVVSTESTDWSWEPSLAVDTLGNVHIAWYDWTDYAGSGTDNDIFYKRWVASTSLWTITEVVSTESTADSAFISLAVDSAGNVHIAWQDWTDYTGSGGTDEDIFYKRWDASTSLWTITEVVSTESTDWSWYPSLAVDSAGNVHIAWQDWTDYAGSGTDQDIFYKLLTISPAAPDLEAPELAFILPNPTNSSSISLVWDSIDGATKYYIYRFESYIWSVEGLTPIATVGSNSYIDSLPSEGYFFYVIVASDGLRYSSLSNCQYVEYKLQETTKTTIDSSLILFAFVFLFVVTRIRKRNFKEN